MQHTVVVSEPEASVRLPSLPHYFSTLVFRDGAREKEYYELSARYHGVYRSSERFKLQWQRVTRILYTAEEAVQKRTRAVLWRSRIRPASSPRYMAVVHFVDSLWQVRAMRHVTSVTITDSDFDFLLAEKFVRRVPIRQPYENRQELHRAVIFGLAPLAARVAA